MRSVIGLALGLLAASGAPPQDAEELGTLQQALTWPDGYGWRQSTGDRCYSSSGNHSGCVRQGTKRIRYGFQAGTCHTWWQTRFVEAHNDFLSLMTGLGWDVSGPSNGTDVEMSCNDGIPGGGNFTPSNSVTQPDGSVTFTDGNLYISVLHITDDTSWFGKSDVQRQRCARNFILHELMHTVGLGHGGPTGHLMRGFSPSGLSSWYSNLKYPSTEENNWLADFQP